MPAPEIEEIVTPEVDPSTETTETAAAPETATSESEEQKRQGGVQRKIDKLTREKYEVLGENKQLRERLEKLEQAKAEKTPTEAAKAEADDPEPKLETFNGSYEEFVKALGRWAARQEHKTLTEQAKAEQAKNEQKERETETLTSYRDRVSGFMAEHDDFDDVVGTIKISAEVAPGLQLAIMDDDNGPALAYYLGQHPEICAELSDMTASKAVLKLGRISAQLFPDAEPEDKDDSPPTTTVKSAPAPIRPVKKVSPTATGLSDDLPYKEWLARREAQIRKRNG